MYLDEILKEGLKPENSDKVIFATIKHDDWCNLLNGKGDCSCDPVIEYKEIGNKK